MSAEIVTAGIGTPPALLEEAGAPHALAREPLVATRRSAADLSLSHGQHDIVDVTDQPDQFHQSEQPDRPAEAPSSALPGRRTYVIDTSVLLSDPWALNRFAEHEVVLPLVVIGELEDKRHHPELGYFARQALRILDDLRVQYGRLDAPVPVGGMAAADRKQDGGGADGGAVTSGGTLHVELNHTDATVLPAGFRNESNDSRILACALNLARERPPGRVGQSQCCPSA